MLEENVIIKKAGEGVVDVFTGKGWNNWSRFNVDFQKGRLVLKLVKGQPMRKEEFQHLYKELSK